MGIVTKSYCFSNLAYTYACCIMSNVGMGISLFSLTAPNTISVFLCECKILFLDKNSSCIDSKLSNSKSKSIARSRSMQDFYFYYF